jgi:hypothetical protein
MVLIVGTSHSIQLGTQDHTVAEGLKFFLENLQHTYNIRAVAEEMSSEALAENQCIDSVPMRVASSLGIKHRFCDPGRCERASLGIRQENDIRASGFLYGWSEHKISSLILKSHAIRERYWLKELRALGEWPVIFVCGADHVASFCALLKLEGITAYVEAEDWGDDKTNEATVSY